MSSRTARLYEYAGAAIVLVSRLLTMPRTFWESDELLFAAAVAKFDPWSSHPHPPGYPLYVGLGKLFALFTGDAFLALTAISVIACVIGYLALARLFTRLLDDPELAACAALIFYFSAAMLVHGTLPLSDSPAIACLALTLLLCGAGNPAGDRDGPAESRPLHAGATQRRAIGLGLAASAAIGIRPQLAVVVVPLLMAMLLSTRNVRSIVAGVISFGVLSAAWFFPLMDALGGWDKMMLWESRQASYVAAHDAAASRGAASVGGVLARFLFHPWGPKWLALPLFVLVALGVVFFVQRARSAGKPAPGSQLRAPSSALALAFVTIVYFLFATAVMDPADAARYSLPHMIGIALLAGAGLAIVRDSTQMRSAPFIVTAIFAIASLAYTAPIIRTRRTQPSPPVAAARYIEANFPSNTIVLYDLSMRPFAEGLLSKFKSVPVEKGLQTYYDQVEIPLVILGDGGSHDPDAKTFAWPESDAYGKVTRNRYRVVTADPVSGAERYAPVAGAYPLERNAEGEEWRWLAPRAAIALPRGFDRVTVTLTLSHDAPFDSNPVTVFVNGRPEGNLNVTRQPSSVTVDLIPLLPPEVEFSATRSFNPAEVLKNRDSRTLAVQLVRVEQK